MIPFTTFLYEIQRLMINILFLEIKKAVAWNTDFLPQQPLVYITIPISPMDSKLI